MVVLCCIVVVTGFLPFLVSRSSLSSPPSQVFCFVFSNLLGFACSLFCARFQFDMIGFALLVFYL